MAKAWIGILSFFMLLGACHTQKPPGGTAEPADAIAFPGAEGYGKWAVGGRGGKVMVVTSLEDDGPGSLRQAVESKSPKIVVFEVSGTIHLKSPLSIKGNTTIAGQTAPGDGICLADYPVQLGGDNIILRYVRIRMGDRYQNKGKVHGAGHDDALSAMRRKHILIDHCSLSWSTDEVLSIYGGDSSTVQWNILAEPLNYSYHFERGDTDFQHHGYGGIWGGRHLSAHHNLLAHCVSRNPRFEGIRNYPEDFVDYRNNVIYNWQSNTVYGGEGGSYNVVNNYYKPGPSTSKKVSQRIANPNQSKERSIPFGFWFVEGNYVDAAAEVTANNRLGIATGDASPEEIKKMLLLSAHPAVPVKTENATVAYQSVLAEAGASYRRDTLDQRIIQDVRNGKGRIIDVQGGFPHGTPYEQSAVAWPKLTALAAPADGDRDGMPDAWETKNGLNPKDASDAAGIKLHRQFTNIEVYINSLTEKRAL